MQKHIYEINNQAPVGKAFASVEKDIDIVPAGTTRVLNLTAALSDQTIERFRAEKVFILDEFELEEREERREQVKLREDEAKAMEAERAEQELEAARLAEESRRLSIIEVIKGLNAETDFTESGAPKVEAINAQIGDLKPVDSTERTELWNIVLQERAQQAGA
jgi:hypothetical protein